MDLNFQELDRLAVRMQRGDRRAAESMYDELASKAYGFMFSRTGVREISEDLVQQLFLRLIEKIESFDAERGHFVVWFWQMARNLLIDHYREKKSVPFSMYEEDQLEAMAVTEMPDMQDRLDYRRLQEFLATLGSEEQELFELRYVASLSYREIAALLGKSAGSLRIAAMRIKEKIKKKLTDSSSK